MDGEDQLEFGVSYRSKAMLVICKDIVAFKMLRNVTVDDMFKDLACNAGQRDLTVIGTIGSFRLLENATHICVFPSIWPSSSIN